MSEIRDNFVKSLDNASTGIKSMMAQLNHLLKETDYALWKNLVFFLSAQMEQGAMEHFH